MERLAKKEEKGKLLSINETEIRDHLGEMVRHSVEEALNNMLDLEAEKQVGAGKYERSDERSDTRAGYYQRNLHTRAGEVSLKVPKLRRLTFETEIIERYRRRESSVEEALIEMYLAGVSVRRVEDITEALWGTKVSSGTVSRLNKKIYETIEKWRSRAIEGEHPFVFVDGIFLRKNWAGEVRNVSVLVAIGVNQDGYREILGIMEGSREDKESWYSFIKHLKERGLRGVKNFTSDKNLGLVESIGEIYPEAGWQRCIVHFYRNVFTAVPKGKIKEVAVMLKAIHAQESRDESLKKGKRVIEELKRMKMKKAASIIENGLEETLTYTDYPIEFWRRIRTNNPLERIMREIRRRTRVVGSFPDGESALMLVSARLRHIAGTKWGTKVYLKMDRMNEMTNEATA